VVAKSKISAIDALNKNQITPTAKAWSIAKASCFKLKDKDFVQV
jgi:hypothetical protein